ncbi:MAG: copper amine oxidase N-terminal domain-containing protein, partial [Eubacterium sp.]|nr:copper amine oxidase N-terminal domain-containing protein [Eubacterium sp.]
VFAANAGSLAASYVSSNYQTNNVVDGSAFSVYLDGSEVTNQFTGDSEIKVTTEGRTLLPVRALGNLLGCNVDWDGTSKVAVLTLGSTTLEVPIGSGYVVVNNEAEKIDSQGTKAIIYEERTYMPFRAVCENFGFSFSYDAATKSIYITSSGTVTPTPSTELQTNAPEKTAEQLAFDQEYPTGAVLGYDANNGPNPGEAYYTSWYKYTTMAKAAGLTDEQINYNLQYVHLNPYNNDSVFATNEQESYYYDVTQNMPESIIPSWSGTYKGEMYECWQWSGVDWSYAGESYAGLTGTVLSLN